MRRLDLPGDAFVIGTQRRPRGAPDEFGKLISDETEKCAKVIRAANIKPD
jgi:hypothetical protein